MSRELRKLDGQSRPSWDEEEEVKPQKNLRDFFGGEE